MAYPQDRVPVAIINIKPVLIIMDIQS